MNIEKFMTPRLLAVASFVEKGSVVADVGTDHAYIPIWLCENEIASNCIAMDINVGPLQRAKDNISLFSLENRIDTRLSNGLEALNPQDADTVIIAGMGGMLINEILTQAKHLYPFIRRYILQPMTAIEETRKFLEQNGFYIENETLAQEEDKIYCILNVVRGEMKYENELSYYIGTKLIEHKHPLLSDYLTGKIYEYDKAIESLRLSDKESNIKRMEHFKYLSEGMKKQRELCKLWYS